MRTKHRHSDSRPRAAILRSLAVALIIASAVASAGCSGKAASTGAAASSAGGRESNAYTNAVDTSRGVPDADGNTPFVVLQNAVMAANSSDFGGADKWILPNSTMGTNAMGRNVMPEKWPPFTRNGQIASIDYVDDSYQSEHAYVHYVVHYKDGSTFKERASLVRDGGRWKLTFMTENTPF